MTADHAACPTILSMPSPLDPVRARIRATRSQAHEPGDAAHTNRSLHLLAETRGNGPRGPHPGDILYWVACLGGACLLLLSATT